MEGIGLIISLGLLGLILLGVNLLLTREVLTLTPFTRERLPLLLILWLLPVIGAFLVFRKIGLDYYKTDDKGGSATSTGLMGMDAFFDPDAKPEQVIEEKVE